MNKYQWAAEELKWFGRRILHALTGDYHVDRSKYAGVGMVSGDVAHDYIYRGISGDKPFAIGKTGFSEIGFICCAQNEIFYNSRIHYHWTPSYINAIECFLPDNGLKRFREIMLDAMNVMDGIGIYPGMFMADVVLKSLPNISNIMLFHNDIHVDTTLSSIPWTKALEGKKVLVVSPFYKEILFQYDRREKLWPDGRLPDFQIDYDPSIWINESKEDNRWFKAYDTLNKRILEKDFDVALLGCGSLGFPIAASIKRAGRKAVQMGSTIHLLFGLKAKRWDDLGLYNEYWIRPGEVTKPKNAESLDGATYW